MKRIILLIVIILYSLSAFTQNEDLTSEDNIIFFYKAKLTNNKGIKCSGFDLDFHINTYKILHHNGYIDSMYVRQNEKQLCKIDSMNWTYSAEFKVSKKQLSNDYANLNIRNIDGNCDLYINKQFVRHYNNSFLTYCDNIKPFLKKGKNKIEFRFSQKDSIRMRQRSPQYLYGWDWFPKTLAPRINAVYLSFEKDVPVIDYADIQTENIKYTTSTSGDALMQINIHFRKPLTEMHEIILTNCPQDFSFHVNHNYNVRQTLQPNITGDYTFEFNIKDAKLWFPNNEGDQNLYKVNICLDNTANVLYQTQFGVRKIHLVREKDKWGESFYFQVNGRPVFAKGANYIMTYKDCEQDIIYAKNANMNMLRIWGGSDYGSDEFFDLCDKNGIMVWQDFPFACELYPVDEKFIDNVKQEAIQNLKRIATHPSLALLCGNNENWEGWENWGWKQLVKDTIQAVKDYDYLFKKVLGGLSQQYIPTIDYIHSSPVNYGWGHKESLTDGDCHYYGVWWADSSFDAYVTHVPRFMSEYGFQGSMNPESLEIFASHPYDSNNADFSIHQKHPRGFELVSNRIAEIFGDYSSDEQYILYSQSVQQEAIKTAVEAQRIRKPYCMGTLFWQYNEPYPTMGWDCLDYSGEPKPAYYTAQMLYQPMIFATNKTEDSVKIYVCSDINEDTFLTYKIKIMNQNDSTKYSYIEQKTLVHANETKLLNTIAYKDIQSFDKTTDYLLVEGFYGDEFISNYAFFTYPKNYVSKEKYWSIISNFYFPEN